MLHLQTPAMLLYPSEQGMMDEHALEQSVRFILEMRTRGGFDDVGILDELEGLYLKKLRVVAPENPFVRAYVTKQADALQEEIRCLRAEMKQREELAEEKERELRDLVKDYPSLYHALCL
ncbi:hypothetical protein B0T20DRAFT_389377 [Sordaria brevicollis]|uniref:Uncharacterized protein n=1 Tax=Sordaria brevicollis TaxID=83679 RepID=A0AAE0UEM4_SORBR|nr:hypothetical protein B0T20DRAFT_389377 [Sordaria brevicollis]